MYLVSRQYFGPCLVWPHGPQLSRNTEGKIQSQPFQLYISMVKTDKKWTSKKKSPGGRVGSGGATGGKLKKPLNKLDKDGNR